jgi:hypothetical protein
MTNNQRDLVDCLFFAFRYALGRRTYAPTIVDKVIREHKHLLTHGDYRQMRNEIYRQMDHRGEAALGDACDQDLWLCFAEYCTKRMHELQREER